MQYSDPQKIPVIPHDKITDHADPSQLDLFREESRLDETNSDNGVVPNKMHESILEVDFGHPTTGQQKEIKISPKCDTINPIVQSPKQKPKGIFATLKNYWHSFTFKPFLKFLGVIITAGLALAGTIISSHNMASTNNRIDNIETLLQTLQINNLSLQIANLQQEASSSTNIQLRSQINQLESKLQVINYSITYFLAR